MANLLIVEDDTLLREALAEQLALGNHQVVVAEGGIGAQQILERQRFDAMVLDLGLPTIDGIALLKWTRQRYGAMPIMILTARDGIDDRVQGLNAGADDYLTKPFDMKELQARIEALLRRARLPAFGGTLQIPAGHGKMLRLDPQLPLAWMGDEMLEVTQREWSLLSLLVARAGQVVSREDVMAVWQNDTSPEPAGSPAAAGSNALEVYIHRLRRKLSASTIQIRNVRGLGYTLTPGE
ncbi:MAG: response regulator transcription factor [Brachymonas sp.]|nr:response regulator transcription factor [Brachymonas sp.]